MDKVKNVRSEHGDYGFVNVPLRRELIRKFKAATAARGLTMKEHLERVIEEYLTMSSQKVGE
jgi:predicted DNA binding CopG/RHH family protein